MNRQLFALALAVAFGAAHAADPSPDGRSTRKAGAARAGGTGRAVSDARSEAGMDVTPAELTEAGTTSR